MSRIVKVLDQPPYIVSGDLDFDMYMDSPRGPRPIIHQRPFRPIESMTEALELATAEKSPQERKIILIVRGLRITVPRNIYRRVLLRNDAGTIAIKCRDELLAHREVLAATSETFEGLIALSRNQRSIKIYLNRVHPLAMRLLLRFLYDNYIEVPETLLVEFNKLVKIFKIRAMNQVTIFSKNDWYGREVESIDFSQDFVTEPISVYDFDRSLVEENKNKSKSNSIDKNERIKERGNKPERSREKERGNKPERNWEKERGNKPERGRERQRGNNPERSREKGRGNKSERGRGKKRRTNRERDWFEKEGNRLEKGFLFSDEQSSDSSHSSHSSHSSGRVELVKTYQTLRLKGEEFKEKLKKMKDRIKIMKQSGSVKIVEIEDKKPESNEKLRLNAEKQRLADAVEQVKKRSMNDIEAAEKYFVPHRKLEKIKKSSTKNRNFFRNKRLS